MKWRFDYLLTVLLCLAVAGAVSAQSTSGSGQVAITGSDGNIYLYDVSSDTITPVTSDASLNLPQKMYNWPTWSTDGQLAYFGIDTDPQTPYSLGVFMLPVGGQAKGVYASQTELFTYAYWSPADCPSAEKSAAACRDLALLYTSEDGLGVHLIRSGEGFPVTELGQGGPFYWDWSPQGDQMLWARFGTQFDYYDVASAATTSLPYEQGFAQSAIDWSPVDDRVLLAVGDSSGTSLVLVEGDQQIIVVEGLSSMAFAWSPNAAHIAYMESRTGALSVYEVAGQQSQAVIPDSALAFFWSPDGAQLAYLTYEGTSDPNPGASRAGQFVGLRWNIYEVATAQTRVLSAFLPSENMVYYLNFFDQFIKSHSLWSPDSRYLVYGEVSAQGDGVILLDTTTGKANRIADGNMGIFSWQ